MANLLLTIAYDGTDYVGWQRQSLPGAYNRSVQGELEHALKKLLGEEISLQGAGRTDAGVHAAGQTASFQTTKSIPPEQLPYAVNGLLPPDIRVLGCTAVEPEFHARFSAIGKQYRYYLAAGGKATAFDWRHLAYDRRRLDFKKMAAAAQLFEGRHNFQRFCLKGDLVKNYEREIYHCAFTPCGPEAAGFPWQTPNPVWRLTVVGNGFLYKMVRLLMGSLLAVGAGRLQPQQLTAALKEEGGVLAPPALACGLFMEEVFYEKQRLAACVEQYRQGGGYERQEGKR